MTLHKDPQSRLAYSTRRVDVKLITLTSATGIRLRPEQVQERDQVGGQNENSGAKIRGGQRSRCSGVQKDRRTDVEEMSGHR